MGNRQQAEIVWTGWLILRGTDELPVAPEIREQMIRWLSKQSTPPTMEEITAQLVRFMEAKEAADEPAEGPVLRPGTVVDLGSLGSEHLYSIIGPSRHCSGTGKVLVFQVTMATCSVVHPGGFSAEWVPAAEFTEFRKKPLITGERAEALRRQLIAQLTEGHVRKRRAGVRWLRTAMRDLKASFRLPAEPIDWNEPAPPAPAEITFEHMWLAGHVARYLHLLGGRNAPPEVRARIREGALRLAHRLSTAGALHRAGQLSTEDIWRLVGMPEVPFRSGDVVVRNDGHSGGWQTVYLIQWAERSGGKPVLAATELQRDADGWDLVNTAEDGEMLDPQDLRLFMGRAEARSWIKEVESDIRRRWRISRERADRRHAALCAYLENPSNRTARSLEECFK